MSACATLLGARVSRPSPEQIDWLKGILILLVVVDHNDYWRSINADVMRPLTVHVIGFFLLAFYASFFDKRQLSDFVLTRLVRYGWPFLLFMALYAIGTVLSVKEHGVTPQKFAEAIATGSFINTKQGGGGAFMWFLPALFGFVVISKTLGKVRPAILAIGVAVGVAFHPIATDIRVEFKAGVPFGILVVLYVTPLVALFFALHSQTWWKRGAATLSGAAILATGACLSYVVLVDRKIFIEVGLLAGPSYHAPDLIALNVLHVIFGLSFLWAVAPRFAQSGRAVRFIGVHSMGIYLLHPLCFRMFSLAQVKSGMANLDPWLLSVVSTVFAVGASLLASVAVTSRPRAKDLIFPESFAALRSALWPWRSAL